MRPEGFKKFHIAVLVISMLVLSIVGAISGAGVVPTYATDSELPEEDISVTDSMLPEEDIPADDLTPLEGDISDDDLTLPEENIPADDLTPPEEDIPEFSELPGEEGSDETIPDADVDDSDDSAEDEDMDEPVLDLAVFLYPYKSDEGFTRGVEVDRPLRIGFINPLSEIGADKVNEINLNKIDAEGNKESVEFTYVLSGNKLLTIQPIADLEYGGDYELLIPGGIEDIEGNRSEETALLFETLSFEQPTLGLIRDEEPVETIKPGDGYQLLATVTNAGAAQRKVRVIIQLRSGKGARYEQGGNVFYKNNEVIEVEAGQSNDIILDFEVPADLDGHVVYGDIFVWEEGSLNANSIPGHFECPVVE